MFKTLCLTLLALLTLASTSAAQTPTGPCPTTNTVTVVGAGWVCITPATDYTATTLAPDGVTQVPLVVKLSLLLFDPTKTNTATDAPTQTIDIGKPARDNANNSVWTQVAALTQIPTGQQWKARAVSVGQPLTAGGAAQVSARSPESNPFIRVAPAPAPLAPLGVKVPEL